ncbi:MAG: hypothetical protein ACI4JZ_02780 [Oscillospiraceae bacterium]
MRQGKKYSRAEGGEERSLFTLRIAEGSEFFAAAVSDTQSAGSFFGCPRVLLENKKAELGTPLYFGKK